MSKKIKRKIGRPSLGLVAMQVQLTASQDQILRKKAEEYGISVSYIVRQLVQASLTGKKPFVITLSKDAAA